LVLEEELKKAKDPDSLINAMKERFPSTNFVSALERGAKANVNPDNPAKRRLQELKFLVSILSS
jgi:hypothetical protein